MFLLSGLSGAGREDMRLPIFHICGNRVARSVGAAAHHPGGFSVRRLQFFL
jgi:hypothetical protein